MRAKCAAGQLDAAVALAVCSLTCLHRPLRQPCCPCRGTLLVERAETLLWEHLALPTIARLQALLLCINQRMETGHFQRAFMLVSLAARAVAAMGLHHERADATPIHQEVRRRIVWSLKLTERYFSHGLSEFELCPFESIFLQLPCAEESFGEASEADGPDSDGDAAATLVRDPSDGSAYAICISLEALRRDIMKTNRAVSLCDKPYPGLVDLIRDFEQRLLAIGARFPHGTDVSHAHLTALTATRWTARHVLMHLSWHQCFCDMHRLLLPGFHEAAPPAVLAAVDARDLAWAESQCLHHASAIIDLLTRLNQLSPVAHLLEFDAAICAYQAALVVLFVSRFGRRNGAAQRMTLEFATSRADLCLAALNRFFSGSALVKPIRAELQRAIRAFVSATEQHGAHERHSREKREKREKLAIHSLLRRADFTEGDDDVTEPEDAAEPDAAAKTAATGLSAEPTGLVSPSFLPGTAEFLLPDALPQPDTTPAALSAAPEAAPFAFTEPYLLPDSGGSGNLYTLDFPLFPWYGLMEQNWSYGNFHETQE